MKQELQYKEKGVETLQEWVACNYRGEMVPGTYFCADLFWYLDVGPMALRVFPFMLLSVVIISQSYVSKSSFSLKILYSFKWKYLGNKTFIFYLCIFLRATLSKTYMAV